MANDIAIIVTAELGDTLLKLDLAKHAVSDLGDASEENAAKQEEAAASSALFSDSLTGLNGVLTQSVPLLGGFQVPLIALPAVAVGAAVAVVALADAIGTLIAIVADLVAPVTLLAGLLGGLGGAFLIAAKSAFGGGGALSGQLGVLKHQFDNLTKTLVQDFMPVFRFLISSAHDALSYLNQIAKLPLKEAFQSLATTGVQAVTRFLEQVGHLVARPLRIAFQIAFGTGKGGNEIASAVSGLFKQVTDFLFGYTKTHQIHIGRFLGPMTTTQVNGLFQPLIDWFNRHDFTKQGEKIGHAILNGFLGSGASQRVGSFLVQVLVDAAKTVAAGIIHQLGRAITWVVTHLDTVGKVLILLGAPVIGLGALMVHAIGGAIVKIVGGWGNVKSAIGAVVGAAKTFWGWLQKIADFFSHVLTLNINWPSPPSWLTSLGGLLGGSGSASTAPGAGRLGAQGGGGRAPSVVQAQAMHFHFHATSNDTASFRRFAREVGREIGRQNHILAGGQ